mgnify:CR=1 FL=1
MLRDVLSKATTLLGRKKYEKYPISALKSSSFMISCARKIVVFLCECK